MPTPTLQAGSSLLPGRTQIMLQHSIDLKLAIVDRAFGWIRHVGVNAAARLLDRLLHGSIPTDPDCRQQGSAACAKFTALRNDHGTPSTVCDDLAP